MAWIFFSSAKCLSPVLLGRRVGCGGGSGVLLTRSENHGRPQRRVQERLCANQLAAPCHLDGELLVLVCRKGGFQDVDSEDATGGQDRRVTAPEFAGASGIVALGEDGLEGKVAGIGDEDVDDADKGEGESHCGGWRGSGDGGSDSGTDG